MGCSMSAREGATQETPEKKLRAAHATSGVPFEPATTPFTDRLHNTKDEGAGDFRTA